MEYGVLAAAPVHIATSFGGIIHALLWDSEVHRCSTHGQRKVDENRAGL